MRYLYFGVGGLFIYDLFMYSQGLLLDGISANVWQARGYVMLLTVPIIAIAAQRNPSWSLRVFISRDIAFYATSVAAVGIYLLLTAFGGYLVQLLGGRWGAVAQTWEFQNELQRPVMFGTRRVGPDLSREGGRRSNDWHAVHFFEPTMLSTGSPMPKYPWLFDGSPDKPNRRGLALITYIQWLGSWLDTYPYYEQLEELDEEEFQ